MALNPSTLTFLASLTTWWIYHSFEPADLLSTSLLLFGVPTMLIAFLRAQFTSLVTAVLTTFVSYYFILLALVIGYRLSPFHPLAQYPGPLPGKISKLWDVWMTAKGSHHQYVRALHDKYGDIVRIGPNELSIRHEDAIAPILTRDLRKGPYYDSRQADGKRALDGIRDFVEHAARRKPWTKATSISAIKGYSEYLTKTVDELVQALDVKQEVDISDWMTFVAFDFMGEMIFSTEFGMIKAGKDTTGIWHALEEGTFAAGILSHIPWIFDFLKHLPQGGSAFAVLQIIGARIAKQRIEAGSSKRDLFHYLVSEDESTGIKLTHEAAISDGMMSIVAGSDTSATNLTHLFYFLLKNPEMKKRLQEEIDHIFPQGEETADYTKQSEMPYLNACINESLRLYPAVLFGLQRRVEKGTGGRMIGPFFVPEGTQVSADLFSLHRDPRYFSPIPDTFWPDRWLTQSSYTLPSGDTIPSTQLIHNKAVFNPFSAGRQNCAGKSIAWIEMRAIMCAVLQRFDIDAVDGFELESYEKSLVEVYVTHRGALPLRLKTRY
ncbi:unnamed protein product [Somion occarium]|uniref:Cytochrome P450 n=1 Tax=Somion occarium TaxID=3059160 RepID=A0ABP1DK86_9APHY